MRQRSAALLFLFSLLTWSAYAQPRGAYIASKDDWEEVNFEFNSDRVIDGYPSLLELADIMRNRPKFTLTITGHADIIGRDRSNLRLAQRRADAVKQWLVENGKVDAGQITTESRGSKEPLNGNAGSRRYRRTDEARWMNRRVAFTLKDENGRAVTRSDLSLRELLLLLQQMRDQQKQCCDEILKKLDQLTGLVQEYQKSFQALAADHQALKADHQRLIADLAKKPDTPVVDRLIKDDVPPIVRSEIEKSRDRRFSLLGMNVGADDVGELTFTGKARYFAPVSKLFGENFAFQAQGEYLYFKRQQEGQFDFGLVNRVGNFQAGLFSSFKHVNMRGMQNGGTLGQGALTADYLFSRGKLGIFGTKGFLNNAIVDSRTSGLSNNITLQRYLSIVDQVGVSATVGIFGNSYLEGNLGYLKSKGAADRPGGTLRLVHPLSDRIAFTLEGGLNETLLSSYNYTRIVAGIQLGNFIRPKEFVGMQGPVPVDVPRVRYEVLTRVVRTGNSPPVADAGPNQTGISAGQVTLNGSGSYDPDNDPITFAWTQVSGPSVSISGMNSATATFTAATGQTYVFRLTVRDDRGAQAIATTTVSTQQAQQVQIAQFVANPPLINVGQSSALSYQVQNADTVTISDIGSVNNQSGTVSVSPRQTTTYRLTARNATSEANATVTVTVNQPAAVSASIQSFSANPSTITSGQSSTLTCQVQNATSVTISGPGGTVGTGGTASVSPTSTTTYTCTANGAQGTTPATATTTVTVSTGGGGAVGPTIGSFSANPSTINSGQSSTLSCQTSNATTVTITGADGTAVGSGSTATVSPTTTTTYTCSASGAAGTQPVQATTTVTVNTGGNPPPATQLTVTSCTASPNPSATPGSPVTLSYQTTGAARIQISGVSGQTIPLSGSVTVNPQTNTTYSLVATSASGLTAGCTFVVNVTPSGNTGQPPTAIITGPATVDTIYRQVNLDASQSTNAGGGPLTFTWRALATGGAVLDQGQPVTRVQVGPNFGDYPFQVTVTNQTGQSATATVTVRYQRNVTF